MYYTYTTYTRKKKQKMGKMYEVDENVNIAFLLIQFEDSLTCLFKRAPTKRLEMWTSEEKQAIITIKRQVYKKKRPMKQILNT